MAGRAAVPEVIWARPERTGRGPKPAFTRADIAAAAVKVADEGGLDAVSMRHVAAELGCGTMSLYNYVPRKEDLYELMVDAISGEHE
ncbi:MAG: TetR/AcrR family transcriptional regulator, partial [Streptomyces sp.]|nr:TetR/AcrR family transcriptional regulator [Streptomyces sp.]